MGPPFPFFRACFRLGKRTHPVYHDVKKPAARLGFGVFGDFTLQTPKTRPPTPLGHRVFGCTKNHDLGLHLRVSVPQQCLRGLLWPYEVRHRLKLLHRRQTSPTGDPECSRLKRVLLEVAAELRWSVRAQALGLLLLLRAFRPSGRSEKGCERLDHVDEASAGLANACDWRIEAVDQGRAVGGLNAAVCRRGSRPTAHPRESCGD